MDENQIVTGAEAFAESVERKFRGVVDALEKARTVILQTAPQFATDPVFLQPQTTMTGKKVQFNYCTMQQRSF